MSLYINTSLDKMSLYIITSPDTYSVPYINTSPET